MQNPLSTLAHRLHHWNRARKWEMFSTELLTPTTSVLDVGFSAKDDTTSYENSLEHSIDDVTRVTALTIEPVPDPNPFPGLTIVRYDGSIFPFDDGEFDVCWSNAVLEHVGDDSAMQTFLSEVDRVSGRAFVTTPNKYFPIEPHTRTPLLHILLPKKQFDRFLTRIGKDWATGSYMEFITEGRLRQLLTDAGISDYELRRNRLGPFTIDFVVMINS